MSETITLAQQLIRARSVTPDDAGCQQRMIERLENIGFSIEKMRFDEVDNFWARRGATEPVLAFAGHTDVVPTGPEERWQHPPFDGIIEDGILHGRGTADMKGSLAAMVVACEQFVQECPDHKGSIAILITSDEEGPAINGTVKVVEALEKRGEKMTWCLVGEPSSNTELGDTVKNGRRGSLGCNLRVKGKQGHVAYPHLAENPIHKAAPALAELASTQWDQGNDFFPPTTFQISNINGGTGATNVIPGTLDVVFNFRYSTETSHTALQQQVEAILDKHKLNYQADWNLSGPPFLTAKGKLLEAAQQAILKVRGIKTELSTAGGTSDGRFIAPTGAQVLELGPLNATIHQVDEQISVKDLKDLTVIYRKILEYLLK